MSIYFSKNLYDNTFKTGLSRGVLLKERMLRQITFNLRGSRSSVVTPNSQNSKPDCELHVTLPKHSTLQFLSELPI